MSIRAHTRSKGHCVAAAIAYRFGCAVTDSRTGVRHDFRRRAERGDVVASGFRYGAQAPAWEHDDPQAFSDALEGAERRKNSQVSRDVEIALPHELTAEQRETLAARWAQHLASRYNAPVAYAVHRPDRRSDERNHHVHCLMSTRALGEDGAPGAKLRQFHVRAKKSKADQEPERTDSGGSDEIHTLRADWEAMCNEALAEAGIDATIAMGRLENPRDRAPNLTRGEVEAERKGWRKRHPETRQPPMRVSWLVVDDGACVTQRGRELARHVTTRALVEHVTGRSATRPRALPAAEPVPEQALAAAAKLQPVHPSPAPEPGRPPRRRRRRRVPRIRAVEAPVATAPAPISLPARIQGVHSAVRAIEAFTVPAPTPITAPERSQEPRSPVRSIEAPLTPAPTRIPALARVLERRIGTLLRAYLKRLGVIRPVKTPLVPVPVPVRPLARIDENLHSAVRTVEALTVPAPAIALAPPVPVHVQEHLDFKQSIRGPDQHAAYAGLKSALTADALEAVGVQIVEKTDHLVYIKSLGLNTSLTAAEELRPHVEPFSVAEPKFGRDGRVRPEFLEQARSAVSRWRLWWRGAAPADILPRIARRVWPTHWQETKRLKEQEETRSEQAAARTAVEPVRPSPPEPPPKPRRRRGDDWEHDR